MVRKSFCYFWLSPKVESSLFLKTQIHQRFCKSAESTLDSALESTIPLTSFSPDSFRKKGCTPPTLPPTIFKCVPKKQPPSLLGGVPSNSLSSKKSAGASYSLFTLNSFIFLHHETGEFWVLSHDLFLTRFCGIVESLVDLSL